MGRKAARGRDHMNRRLSWVGQGIGRGGRPGESKEGANDSRSENIPIDSGDSRAKAGFTVTAASMKRVNSKQK